MRFFTARSLALATLVPALVLFVVVPGCAKQNEGERCGDTLGAAASKDCDDGLTCKYIGPDKGDNRCCYSDGRIGDSRCEPFMATGNGGTGGGAATAGGGTGGVATAGGGTGGSGIAAGGSIDAQSGAGGEDS